MATTDRLLADLARANYGVITRVEATALGITDRQLRRRVANGALDRHHPGVYVLHGAPASLQQLHLLATEGSSGVLSHRSAAYVHGLYRRPPPRPEVTIHPNRRFRHPSMKVHRHVLQEEDDIVIIDGTRITSPARTFVDLGTRVSYTTLVRAYERGVRDELFTHADVGRTRQRIARRGRNGVGPARLLLGHRSPDLAATESDLEQLLWEIIERFDLPQPRRQLEVCVEGRCFRLDLAYPEKKIALEGDGFGVHTERRAFENDRLRQNALVLDGWLILRFTWQQLLHEPAHVARTIRRALDAR